MGIKNLTKLKLSSVFLLLTAATAAKAQFPANPHTLGPPSSSHPGDDTDKRADANLHEKMAIARNDERQKRLVSDTDKLVALVTQLKTDVDKTDKYMLSLEVVKRSEEIEKLARSIKERAKN